MQEKIGATPVINRAMVPLAPKMPLPWIACSRRQLTLRLARLPVSGFVGYHNNIHDGACMGKNARDSCQGRNQRGARFGPAEPGRQRRSTLARLGCPRPGGWPAFMTERISPAPKLYTTRPTTRPMPSIRKCELSATRARGIFRPDGPAATSWTSRSHMGYEPSYS